MKETWTYKNKQLIVILSLLVALFVQTFIEFIPKQTIAYVQPERHTFEQQIENRAEEIFEERREEYMEYSRVHAMTEYQKKLEVLTREIDTSYYK